VCCAAPAALYTAAVRRCVLRSPRPLLLRLLLVLLLLTRRSSVQSRPAPTDCSCCCWSCVPAHRPKPAAGAGVTVPLQTAEPPCTLLLLLLLLLFLLCVPAHRSRHTCAFSPNSFWKMPKVPGPHTSWVISLSTRVQMFCERRVGWEREWVVADRREAAGQAGPGWCVSKWHFAGQTSSTRAAASVLLLSIRGRIPHPTPRMHTCPGATLALSLCLARIFSVMVMGDLTCRGCTARRHAHAHAQFSLVVPCRQLERRRPARGRGEQLLCACQPQPTAVRMLVTERRCCWWRHNTDVHRSATAAADCACRPLLLLLLLLLAPANSQIQCWKVCGRCWGVQRLR
jgi:hypothetical protein